MSSTPSSSSGSANWWRDGVLYQIYPRSWKDSNGDGIGDLRGVIERLDHLVWLGIDAVWLNPVTPSPNEDWGYDVSDYTSVHPDLGNLEDLDELILQGERRGIRIILDLVPNHTSDRHPWFVESRTSRESPKRDWYVWADPKADGSPPNNWVSVFGGEAAWESDPGTGQYYLHNFLKSQPDLNWWNEGVREAFDDILSFWFDRGIAGFRIDVAHSIVKDRDLRDNPPLSEDDPPLLQAVGQRPMYNMNRPEVHDILRGWRTLANGYQPPRALIGETFVYDLEEMASYYGRGGDELHLAFNFPFAFANLESKMLRDVVEATESLIPRGGWPVWMASNHDIGRFPTRWCDDDDRRIRCAIMILLALRGTPLLYYGDELGMGEPRLAFESLKDPVGIRNFPDQIGRDPARTPMQWDGSPEGGFTVPGVKPWLPVGDAAGRNAEDERSDPSSILNLTRGLIELRRSSAEFRRGRYASISAPEGVWAWRRGTTTTVVINLSERSQSCNGITGSVVIGTDRNREGDSVEGSIKLRPWEGVIVGRDRLPERSTTRGSGGSLQTDYS